MGFKLESFVIRGIPVLFLSAEMNTNDREDNDDVIISRVYIDEMRNPWHLLLVRDIKCIILWTEQEQLSVYIMKIVLMI